MTHDSYNEKLMSMHVLVMLQSLILDDSLNCPRLHFPVADISNKVMVIGSFGGIQSTIFVVQRSFKVETLDRSSKDIH